MVPRFFTERTDGDFCVDGDAAVLEARRRRVVDRPWTWLHQVHGASVVQVDHPGQHAGAHADAAVSSTPGVVLAVHTADCVPVLLASADRRVIGAAHVGWRGLLAGVVGATAAAMADLGGPPATAHVLPHIRARCYEFGAVELDRLAARIGEVVHGVTAWGTPALDLTAAVSEVCRRAGTAVSVEPGCTACEPDRFFSHRARGDTGRHAAVTTLEP